MFPRLSPDAETGMDTAGTPIPTQPGMERPVISLLCCTGEAGCLFSSDSYAHMEERGKKKEVFGEKQEAWPSLKLTKEDEKGQNIEFNKKKGFHILLMVSNCIPQSPPNSVGGNTACEEQYCCFGRKTKTTRCILYL